ncbi:Uncharacterised protein [Vibrio cholerae]|uniref:Uncharacterized protein n=1 Tax=Vibrio cholerae TaxID=666 RepID=A0A655SKA3_VIBCL|nr:Uncharacterised protein [Vibrio cholerae]
MEKRRRQKYSLFNVPSMGSDLINLASVLRRAVIHIINVHYPVIKPIGLEKAVNEILSTRQT